MNKKLEDTRDMVNKMALNARQLKTFRKKKKKGQVWSKLWLIFVLCVRGEPIWTWY